MFGVLWTFLTNTTIITAANTSNGHLLYIGVSVTDVWQLLEQLNMPLHLKPFPNYQQIYLTKDTFSTPLLYDRCFLKQVSK